MFQMYKKDTHETIAKKHYKNNLKTKIYGKESKLLIPSRMRKSI